ncbi:CYP-14A1 protein, partial [Aphelenchoides avenae]
MLADYESCKEAMVTKGEHFNGKPSSAFIDYLTYIPNGGIFTAVGDNWREQRRVSLAILRDFGLGKSRMEAKILDCAQQLSDQLEQAGNLSKFDIAPHFSLLVANVLNELLFGYKFKDADEYARFDQLRTEFEDSI